MNHSSDPAIEASASDLVLLSEIQPVCGDLDTTHGPMAPAAGAAVEADHRSYLYRCDVCGTQVTVVVPDPGSSTASQILPIKHETELMPDDGVSLAAIGFRCARWPEHEYMPRRSKATIAGTAVPKTDYLYGCDCSKIRVVVDRAPGTTAPKLG